VGDELVAGAPKLVGVALAGELERTRDGLAIDPRAVLAGRVELLDDGEEVAEQLVLSVPG
jgi:hypothetical protein